MDDTGGRLIQFHGTFDSGQDRLSRFTASVRFHRWDPTYLDVRLLWDGDAAERRTAAIALRYLGRNHVWLRAINPHQPSVELLGISQIKTDDREGTIRVAAVQSGITQHAHSVDARYEVVVRLQPSGILCLPSIHQQHFTGEVQVERIVDGIVSFETCLGTLEARETYEYRSMREYGNDITQCIQRASIMGQITVPKGQTFYAAHEMLKLEVDNACTALSLCYRQPVDYYEIEYFESGDGFPRAEALFRRRWSSSREKQRGDELINVRGLLNGGLWQLIQAIRSCPESQSVTRAIQFLASSYEASLETSYFMAFSAMETVVNSCLDDGARRIVSAPTWKKVSRQLRKTIDELGVELKIPVDGMKDKVAELNRATLVARVEEARARFEPKTDDLWPDRPFLNGIQNASRIRNGLFHAADPTTSKSMYGDLVRIRIFTERLILKRLAWPEDRIWNWYDQNLKWTNQG